MSGSDSTVDRGGNVPRNIPVDLHARLVDAVERTGPAHSWALKQALSELLDVCHQADCGVCGHVALLDTGHIRRILSGVLLDGEPR